MLHVHFLTNATPSAFVDFQANSEDLVFGSQIENLKHGISKNTFFLKQYILRIDSADASVVQQIFPKTCLDSIAKYFYVGTFLLQSNVSII